jgi:diaminopimelate decarboxylase
MVGEFLARADLLAALVARHGTPVHVVFPQILVENVESLRAPLVRRPVRNRLFYAHKANQSTALVRAAASTGIGIDVASPGELRHAQRCGVPADRIEATGPKGSGFLAELVEAGVCVNVDNPWELTELVRLARDARRDRPIPVLLRLCPGPPSRISRFGTPAEEMPALLDVVAGNRDAVELLGFAFHLDTAEVREKLAAIDTCLRLFELAAGRGLAPHVLNVGGGYRQVFIDDPAGFDRYVQALKAGLTGAGEPMSWDGNTFGYRYQADTLHGTPVFHKYANVTPAADTLTELLDGALPSQGGRRVTQILSDNLIELWLEPGKALVDRAGITIAGVEFTKRLSGGDVLVNLDLSRDKISPADQEVMLDPLVIPRADPTRYDHRPVGVYFAGNLCLERDMVTIHKTYLPTTPLPGDLVVFINTAAYQVDLSASAALMRPPPPKLAATRQDTGFIVEPDTEDPGE